MAYYKIIIPFKEAVRMGSKVREFVFYAESDNKPSEAQINKMAEAHIDHGGWRWREPSQKPIIEEIKEHEFLSTLKHERVNLADYT